MMYINNAFRNGITLMFILFQNSFKKKVSTRLINVSLIVGRISNVLLPLVGWFTTWFKEVLLVISMTLAWRERLGQL